MPNSQCRRERLHADWAASEDGCARRLRYFNHGAPTPVAASAKTPRPSNKSLSFLTQVRWAAAPIPRIFGH